MIALLAVLLAGPQQAIGGAARPDNLRLASAIVAARERPGNIVFYIPFTMHVLGTGYPAPFLRLRDLALARSALASATLTGTEITSPAELKSRFTDVSRVWVVTGASNYKFPTPATRMDKEKMALLAGAGLHVIGRWQRRRGHAHPVRSLTGGSASGLKRCSPGASVMMAFSPGGDRGAGGPLWGVIQAWPPDGGTRAV